MSTIPEAGTLALYTSPWCWYCRRVIQVIDRLALDIELRDVSRKPEHRQELAAATGRRTVPVLRITHLDGAEEWMFESREIVRYLESRFRSNEYRPLHSR